VADRLRVGVLLTHPVQYFAPMFRQLATEPTVELTVYFAHRPTPQEQGEGFGVAFEWDVDLLGGFESHFLHNVSKRPSTSTFAGCDTPEVASIIMQQRFDSFLVMGWHSKSYWQAMRACWSTGTPVLVRGDSQLGGDGVPLRAWVRRLTHRRFIPRFAACLAVGTRSAEYFRFYGARRVVRSPHFVDNEFFARGAATAVVAATRRAWGVPDHAVIVGFVGKLVPKKRPLDVVEAVAKSGRRDVHVVYVGDGVLREACRAAAHRLSVPATFAGFCNQTSLPAAYAALDVLVLPSDARETWGLVVNEAMACGVPAVVSSAAGCAPDLVVEAQTGYSFPVGDVRMLAALLDTLASSSELRRRLGQMSRTHISANTAQAAVAGILEAVALSARERAA
jgi:glycosyltransferase involved in cell wall biosynthesis